MEVAGQLHEPAALPPGKEPLVSIGQETWWSQSLSGCNGEERNSQTHLGIEPRSSSQEDGENCITNKSIRAIKPRKVRWAGHIARMGGDEKCVQSFDRKT